VNVSGFIGMNMDYLRIDGSGNVSINGLLNLTSGGYFYTESGGYAQFNSSIVMASWTSFYIDYDFHVFGDFITGTSGIHDSSVSFGAGSSITGIIDGLLNSSENFGISIGSGSDDVFYIGEIYWLGTVGVSTDAVIYVDGDLYVSACDFDFQDSALYLDGNWNTVGVGTLTPTSSTVTMTLDGSTIQMDNTDYFNILKIEANVTVPTWAGTYDFYVYTTHTMTVDSDFNITHNYTGFGTGTVDGLGHINHFGNGEIYSVAPIDVDYFILAVTGTEAVVQTSDVDFTKNLTVDISGKLRTSTFVLTVTGLTFVTNSSTLMVESGTAVLNGVLVNRSSQMSVDSAVICVDFTLQNTSFGWFNATVTMSLNMTLETSSRLYVNATLYAEDIYILSSATLFGFNSTIYCHGSWESPAGVWVEGTSTVIMSDVGTITISATQGFWNLTILTSHTITLMSDLYVYHFLYIPGLLVQNSFDVFIITDTPYCLVVTGNFDEVITLMNQTVFYPFVPQSMSGWLNFENTSYIDFGGGLLRVTPTNCSILWKSLLWAPSTQQGAVIAKWRVLLNTTLGNVTYELFRLIAASDYKVMNPDTSVFSGRSNALGIIKFNSLDATAIFVVTLMSGQSQNIIVTPPTAPTTVTHLYFGMLFMLVGGFGMILSKKGHLVRRKMLWLTAGVLVAGIIWCVIYGAFWILG
jgi:hypothetical protein